MYCTDYAVSIQKRLSKLYQKTALANVYSGYVYYRKYGNRFAFLFFSNNYLPVEKSTKETEKDVLIVNNKEPRRCHRSGDFIVIFKHISHLFPVFLQLTLNKQMLGLQGFLSSLFVLISECFYIPPFMTHVLDPRPQAMNCLLCQFVSMSVGQ